MKYVATLNDQEYLVEILDEHRVRIGEQVYTVDFTTVSDQPMYSILVDGHSYEGYVFAEEHLWNVVLRGTLYSVLVEDEREKRLRAAAGGNVVLSGDTPVKAPMPGLIISVQVEEGQTVAKGDTLVVLESMKMQNELLAPREGLIARLQVESGQSVERNQLLCYVSSPD